MSEERLERIEGKVDILVSGQIALEARLDKVEGGQEDLRNKVMQIAEGHAAHTRQIALGFEALHMALERHQRPLEDAVRDHTAILKRNRIS